uniref:Microbial-type PARG catalytic domain-containing protein n=1 Tax=Marseillevirus LCMAC201 TaxID=2506605 RepID=A0A481YVM5_9VIRU|nr:MAG: protein of unknown function DUF2263 [Marseillevirus LCMAC201]
MEGKDDRRSDRFAKTKKHFSSGKYKPKTKRDKTAPRIRPPESSGENGRKENTRIAKGTVDICNNGFYSYKGNKIDIMQQLEFAKQQTMSYSPEETPINVMVGNRETQFQVVKTQTLEACQIEGNGKEDEKHICVLNFASAKNPGGGFLKGSNAQEESIARASGLYACIKNNIMYEKNAQDNNKCLYSHHMIFSPTVPVFRDKNDDLIEKPFCISFITSPAVNAKQAKIQNIDNDVINQTMLERMDRFLSVTVWNHVDILILGAWGCGVFGGNNEIVAKQFFDLLTGKYYGMFEKVIFTVIGDADFTVFSRLFGSEIATESKYKID